MIRKQEITTFEFPADAIIWDVRDASAYAEDTIIVVGWSNLPLYNKVVVV